MLAYLSVCEILFVSSFFQYSGVLIFPVCLSFFAFDIVIEDVNNENTIVNEKCYQTHPNIS